MRPVHIVAAASIALVMAGCVERRVFESEPIRVPTTQGNVVCQLYTKNNLNWDKSIARPYTMTRQEADQLCRSLGGRLAGGGNVSIIADLGGGAQTTAVPASPPRATIAAPVATVPATAAPITIAPVAVSPSFVAPNYIR